MNKKDLWKQGKPAKEFPSDWLVVPVKDAVEHEAEAVRLEQKRIFKELDELIYLEESEGSLETLKRNDAYIQMKKRFVGGKEK